MLTHINSFIDQIDMKIPELAYGPQNKSVQTQTFELLVKLMAHRPHLVNVSVKKSSNQKKISAHALINDVKIDIHQLIQSSNLNHVSLNTSDSDAAVKLLSKQIGFHHNSMPHSPLSKAEYLATHDYTIDGSYTLNSFLYGKNLYKNPYVQPQSIEYKQLVMNAGFLSSAINKLYDVDANHFPCYRGDDYMSQTLINELIDKIKTGHCITDNPSFKSTTSDYDIAEAFSERVCIIFEDAYGKSIEHYSEYSDEQEYLLPPGKWHWYDYLQSIDGTTQFYVRVIEPLCEESEHPSDDAMHQFANLVNIAKSESIDLSFITPHNLSKLGDLIAHQAHNPSKMSDSSCDAETIAELINHSDKEVLSLDHVLDSMAPSNNDGLFFSRTAPDDDMATLHNDMSPSHNTFYASNLISGSTIPDMLDPQSVL